MAHSQNTELVAPTIKRIGLVTNQVWK